MQWKYLTTKVMAYFLFGKNVYLMNMTFTFTLISSKKDITKCFLFMKPDSFRHLVDIATVWTDCLCG